MKLLAFLITVTVMLLGSIKPAYAVEFDELELAMPFSISQTPLFADVHSNPGKELVLIGSGAGDTHQIAIVGIAQNKLVTLDSFAIAKRYFAFDVLDNPSTESSALFFMANDHIAAYRFPLDGNAPRLEKYLDIDSFYRITQSNYLAKLDFIDDLNLDGEADVRLPNFEYYSVWLSKKTSQHKHHKLPIASEASLVRRTLEVQQPNLAEVKGQTPSVFFSTKGKIQHYVLGKNLFEKKDIIVSESIHGLNWWDVLDDSGQSLDQSKLSHRVVETIKDVNGDEIVDLVVRYTQSSGALERRNDYEVYFGSVDKNGLSFTEKPSTVIASEGTLTDLLLEDLNGDKKLEVVVSSFEISVSQIVSALLSGSIDQDVLVYRQDAMGEFSKKPAASFETEMHFSLSKGRAGQPLVAVADVNGDGLKDLLMTANNEEVRVRTANSTGKFNKVVRVKTTVPKSGNNIKMQDLNGDGRFDIIMVYDRLDEDSKLTLLKVLMAK
ncbi:hypothetical protein PALB_9490 [Pseudoalteromonas luteoviolacea B = ATCC 29581]|nr:hypothetical protein PALB_9490 [Pseudoalteromonas luteoviolacea B = ATCC 29581]